MNERRFPEHFYNWISLAGAALAVGAFSIIVLLILIDFVVQETTLYLGMLTYMILPGFLVAGLAMVLGGALWERRRRARGLSASMEKSFNIDLRNPQTRRAILIGVAVTSVFLVASSLGTYKAYHISESTKFCGTLCHAVMSPEYTAYQRSSHARVACVACHIGPGADWFVKSKLTGAYQVYSTIFHKYARPIETPIKNLRPARDTCLQCHWPEKFFGERKHVNPHFLADEKNTPYPITLLVKIGGGSAQSNGGSGIHWHMMISNKLEYIARDRARQDIAWVRTTARDGRVTVYEDPDNALKPDEKAKAEIRTMDCIDCHNRPSHNYRPPQKEVNAAMAAGEIPTNLPYIKREAVKALDAEYADSAAARAAIADKIRGFYEKEYPAVWASRRADVETAARAVQSIYAQNFFPEMRVTWRAYPENIGHSLAAGCFRCHGSGLKTSTGETITKNCSTCHTIMAQGTGPGADTVALKGLPFRHPQDIGGMEQEGQCSACHQGGAELY